jgi:hypothetical protein
VRWLRHVFLLDLFAVVVGHAAQRNMTAISFFDSPY